MELLNLEKGVMCILQRLFCVRVFLNHRTHFNLIPGLFSAEGSPQTGGGQMEERQSLDKGSPWG